MRARCVVFRDGGALVRTFPVNYGPNAMRGQGRQDIVAGIVAAGVLAAACTGSSVQTGSSTGSVLDYGDNARRAYQTALEAFQNGNCADASATFENIRRDFPYSRFAALAELRIADCLLRRKKYAKAIRAYRQFVQKRPSHNQIPYARFKVAHAHFEQIPGEWLLSPPAYERDQAPTRQALRELRKFLRDFPDDPRAPEAREMQQRALQLLARHELYVARFYRERDAPKAAVGRLKTLLEAYPGSGLEPRALLMLGRTYLEMKDRPRARRAFKELVQQFPDSEQAKAAQGHLSKLGPTPSARR